MRRLALFILIMAILINNSQAQASSELGRKLAQKKIYFGHMSVGNNILLGVGEFMKADPSLNLKIVEINGRAKIKPGTLAHSRVGKNGEPKTKIDSFRDIMSNGLGGEVDIAFFKFCYIDILESTNIDDLFNYYKTAMADLKRKFPKVKFVHVTVPIRTVQRGWKAVVKKIANFPVGGYGDNIKRNQYNEYLRKEFAGKEPILDLELMESTYPDGNRSFFRNNGKTYYSLVQEYTYDGGHLNEYGRRIIAGQFLAYLAGF